MTANAKQRAVQGLMNFVQEKRTSFEEIDGVDYQSLQEQTRLLKMAGAHAKANIDSLTRKQELVPAVTIGRQEILAVAEPELLQVYQAPKVEDLEQALSQLEMTGKERKTQFNELVHAKETARQQQKKQVDELVTEFESKMRVAQSNQTLNTLLLEGQDAIHHVALPALDDNFMSVKKSAINAAKQTIQQVAQQRTEEIKQLKEIDAESREDRLKQLDELVANYEPALALAQTVGELRRTTDLVESLIRLLADPERQVKKQEKPVTPEVPVSPVKPVEPMTPKAPADSAIPVTPSNESDSPSQASGEDAKRPSNENRVVPADDFNEPTFVNYHLDSSPKAKALTGNKVQQNAIPHSLGIRAADYPVRNESTVTEKMFADQSSKSSKEGRHPLPETAKESNPNQMVKRTFLALLLSMLPFVKGRLRQKD
ncbi:hypothetical protein [Fructobacillus fructosus]|uniref:hypothetical protein n=1 Tax=Fructobacillus fructosus TaxID=1631 RepID=UPI0030C7E015